ncbi:hypothetical protein F5884DRAFT_816938 [Xylogone sp. PMI_703]|nr:hypothetical protein F5884DRAFT_816938 [Xylogone sp. PMI_703]
MSTTRLTFLYPHLFRGIRFSEPVIPKARVRNRPQCYRQAPKAFSTSECRRQAIQRRHGKAVEPQKSLLEEELQDLSLAKDATDSDKKDVKLEKDQKEAEAGPQGEEQESKQTSVDDTSLPTDGGSETTPIGMLNASTDSATAENNSKDGTHEVQTPLETVLHMPPPDYTESESKPPHLQPPPYVHHFDTYTLVQQVEAGGFTEAQSITFMKAIRGLLAHHLDIAKAGLVSKNDVDNESYLFRAACSELRTEIQNSRRANEESTRRDRTMLQHEVDILNQKLTQELLTLKDELKGMFDDRKMDVRMEQRSMDSSIQELNYKITVALNSDSKSNIEGMRWVLTRRSVMAILFMAVMVLSSLRYASYKAHMLEEEEKKQKKQKEEEKKHSEKPTQDLPEEAAEVLAAN